MSFYNTFKNVCFMLAVRGYPINLELFPYNEDVHNEFEKFIQNNSNNYNQLYKLYQIHIEKGIDISGYISLFLSNENEFKEKYGFMRFTESHWTPVYKILKGGNSKNDVPEKSSHSFVLETTNDEYTFVYFADSVGESAVSKKTTENLFSAAEIIKNTYNINLNSIIFVIPNKLSPDAIKNIELSKDNYFIQIFEETELSSNPMECVWGSETKLLTKEESEDFLTRNMLDPLKMPRIPIDDAVIKYLGGKKDIVVETTRTSLIPDNLIKSTIVHSYTYIRNKEKAKTKKKQ